MIATRSTPPATPRVISVVKSVKKTTTKPVISLKKIKLGNTAVECN